MAYKTLLLKYRLLPVYDKLICCGLTGSCRFCKKQKTSRRIEPVIHTNKVAKNVLDAIIKLKLIWMSWLIRLPANIHGRWSLGQS